MSAETRTLPVADLEARVARVLEAAGTRAESAASVSRALVAAEIDGQKGHGLARTAGYAAQVLAGKVAGAAQPQLKHVRPGTAIVDAEHGFAYPAFDLAIPELARLAAACGIAAVGVVRSHHAGALGLVVERLAERGLVALMFANTPSAMAAWGGTTPMLGTNPIAFAAPRQGGAPVVVDLALSQVARARIVAAAAKGEPIPLGWATDRDGRPTTDARAALQGTLLPAGGAKGAALALMVELLAAGVTGANFAGEASSFLDDQGPPPGTGQLIVAIDAGALGGGSSLPARVGALAALIEQEPGARLPGSGRWALRAKAAAEGIAVEARLLAELDRLSNA